MCFTGFLSSGAWQMQSRAHSEFSLHLTAGERRLSAPSGLVTSRDLTSPSWQLPASNFIWGRRLGCSAPAFACHRSMSPRDYGLCSCRETEAWERFWDQPVARQGAEHSPSHTRTVSPGLYSPQDGRGRLGFPFKHVSCGEDQYPVHHHFPRGGRAQPDLSAPFCWWGGVGKRL